MEKLSPNDIKILEEEIKSRKLTQLVFLGLTAAALILLVISQYLQWEFPASLFIGVFGGGLAFGLIANYFINRNVVRDFSNGVKTTTTGVIIKKEMKGGPNSYYIDYPKESLEKMVKHLDNKAKGLTSENGTYDSKAAQASFLIMLDNKSDHSVGIRNYINLNIGDNVRIELAPLSKTFLSVTKL